MNKKFTRNNDEDEDDFSVKDNSQLQFYTKVNRVYRHDVFIDQPFVDSSYYRTDLQYKQLVSFLCTVIQ